MAKTRLTLDIADSVRNRMELMCERTGAASLVEVVRKALAVYDAVTAPGTKVIQVYPDGREVELVIL